MSKNVNVGELVPGVPYCEREIIIEEDMAAFDRLPQPVRQALANCVADLVAGEVLQAMFRGANRHQIIAEIEQINAAFIENAYRYRGVL